MGGNVQAYPQNWGINYPHASVLKVNATYPVAFSLPRRGVAFSLPKIMGTQRVGWGLPSFRQKTQKNTPWQTERNAKTASSAFPAHLCGVYSDNVAFNLRIDQSTSKVASTIAELRTNQKAGR